MSLSKIRTYLENNIKAVDADFRQHDDAFNSVNIANIEKAFHISYSVASTEVGQQMLMQTASISVKFYFKGFRDTIKMFDTAMDLVNDVAMGCASRTNVAAFRASDDFPIQNIDIVSQVPEQLESNDNSMSITLEMSADIYRSIC